MTFDLQLSLSDLFLMLPELWVTLWICVVLCVDFLMPRLSQRTIAGLSVAGMGVALLFLLGFYAAGTHGVLFKGMFVLDGLALFFKIFVVGAAMLVILASIDYVGRFRFFKSEYYFLVMMAALGMMFMASANDLLSVFVTLEFSTFGFYVMVAYLRDDLRSSEAGLKFFILGVFAAALLVYGISLVYGETGTFLFTAIAAGGADLTPGLAVGWLLIFAALGFKIGAVP
ncbi:MAG: NADH-quinone oxidoreductase subunit N, partial [Nitrospirae bacterium]